jgi:hypothetical protein
MASLEQVEKLREMANISYEEAKAALDAANGNLLDAVIYLEKQGKVTPPSGGGFYSSEKTSNLKQGIENESSKEKGYHTSSKENTFLALLKQFGEFTLKMIRKGNRNTFKVVKDGETKVYFPVTVLAILVIFAFWVTIPLAIIGLFFGFRYRFVGPDFHKQTINEVIDSAADAAENLKKSVM